MTHWQYLLEQTLDPHSRKYYQGPGPEQTMMSGFQAAVCARAYEGARKDRAYGAIIRQYEGKSATVASELINRVHPSGEARRAEK